MATILCNVFTTAMLSEELHEIVFAPITIEEARASLNGGFEQAVGHPATCEVLSARLGVDVQPVRANVALQNDDVLVVAQVVIPRLAEGQVLSQEQVESCPIRFWLVKKR